MSGGLANGPQALKRRDRTPSAGWVGVRKIGGACPGDLKVGGEGVRSRRGTPLKPDDRGPSQSPKPKAQSPKPKAQTEDQETV